MKGSNICIQWPIVCVFVPQFFFSHFRSNHHFFSLCLKVFSKMKSSCISMNIKRKMIDLMILIYEIEGKWEKNMNGIFLPMEFLDKSQISTLSMFNVDWYEWNNMTDCSIRIIIIIQKGYQFDAQIYWISLFLCLLKWFLWKYFNFRKIFRLKTFKLKRKRHRWTECHIHKRIKIML